MKSKLHNLLWVFMLPAILIPWLATQHVRANVDETYYTYLPVILKNYPPPPDMTPQPWVERVSVNGEDSFTEIDVPPGKSFTLRIEVSNRSDVHTGFLGQIVVGLPDLDNASQVSNITTDMEMTIYNPDAEGYATVRGTQDVWKPRERHYIEMEIGPRELPGDFRIYVKGKLGRIDGQTFWFVSPLGGKPSATDSDGDLSQVYTVTPDVYPQPWVKSVSLGGVEDSTEINIAPGESFTLRVAVSNRSSVHTGFLNEIVVGFPHYTAPFPPVNINAHDLESAVVASNGSYQQVMATTLTWNPGEQHTIDITVGPLRTPGTFPIYIKGVMSSIDGLTYRHVSPVDGKPSALDAYGELSQVYTVNVANPGVGIGRLNYYRSLAGVPEAAELPYWSQGCVSHAYYMVMNGILTHAEDTANPYYTYAGYAAGQSSNLAGFSVTGIGQQDGWPVDVMMQSVFHAIPMLDPRLTLAGYGLSTEENSSVPFAACLDVYRGVNYSIESDYPVYWPPADSVTPLIEYAGGETPDPLSACGYTAPSGAPLFLILGAGTTDPTLTTHSLKQDGVDIPHCAFDYETYTNPTPPHQQDGRDVLDYYDALVIMPRDPLEQGSTYTASMTADGQTYTWDFQVAPGFVDAPESQVLAPGRNIQ